MFNTDRDINILVKGENNSIIVEPEMSSDSKVNITVYGNNNKITMGRSKNIINLNLQLGYKDGRTTNNSAFKIGNDAIVNGMNIFLLENKTKVEIGNNCMISSNIELRCTDDHSVIDNNNEVINKANSIIIRDHVWICKDVKILKNSYIPNNSIVGCMSVVAKEFRTPNVAICGNLQE